MCVRACVRACVPACLRACVRACVCVCCLFVYLFLVVVFVWLDFVCLFRLYLRFKISFNTDLIQTDLIQTDFWIFKNQQQRISSWVKRIRFKWRMISCTVVAIAQQHLRFGCCCLFVFLLGFVIVVVLFFVLFLFILTVKRASRTSFQSRSMIVENCLAFSQHHFIDIVTVVRYD